jgi:hypothetical protein
VLNWLWFCVCGFVFGDYVGFLINNATKHGKVLCKMVVLVGSRVDMKDMIWGFVGFVW